MDQMKSSEVHVNIYIRMQRCGKKNYLCLGGTSMFSFFDSLLFFLGRLLFECPLCLRCLCFSSDSLSDPTDEENSEDESWELRDESAEWEVLFLLPSSTKARNIMACMSFH